MNLVRWLIIGAVVFGIQTTDASQIIVSITPEVREQLPQTGRLFLFFARNATPEPRLRIGWAGPNPMPFFAVDVRQLPRIDTFTVPDSILGYPIKRLRQLPRGQYVVQALLDSDTLFSYLNAPGNYYSTPRKITWDRNTADTVRLILSRRISPEALPPDSGSIRFVEIKSQLLSSFWNRPMVLRAGVILPRDYDANPQQYYPVVYHIGGFHTRYTAVRQLMEPGHPFRQAWESPDVPQMIVVQLDGESPFGDCYQMNSDNNGPYMDALLQELIPAIESRFRAVGKPAGRFLTGESTGGWVSLALQIWNPTFFNGAWSFCPDAVDFHYLQLVDIYNDSSAFVNEFGYQRPSMRMTDGEPVFSIRQEIWMENVMGRTNRFVTSGGQWGSWNAVFGPRGKNGLPKPIWDPWSGQIHREVANHWRKYDLLDYLKTHWETVGSQLQGKLHIWMGDMDSFYLNNALRNLEQFLKQVNHPVADARIYFQPGAGHCWLGITWAERLQQMARRFQEARESGK